MKPTGQVVAVVLLVALVAVAATFRPAPRSSNPQPLDPRLPPASTGEEDDAGGRDELEFLIARDPRANAIPSDIRRREAEFARTLPIAPPRRSANGRAQLSQTLSWTERGPNNVGGRTRAFAVDVASPTRLIAGSVAGGIWLSTNDGASWSLRTSPGQIHGTSCIAQDTRAGQTNTWYVGTGEIRGSTTNATRWGSNYYGDGIFKSTDGGVSWTLLPSTSTATPQVGDPFDYVINVATNPANVAQDEVIAATFKGIYRSVDGGGSWTQVLASDSSFTDIAITPTGVMYAVTRSAGLTRVWRSPNGTSWNPITTTGFPALMNRVVIGLAASNPAIAYFFCQGHLTGPNGHQLWKYTYLSGDGGGAGGSWENRTNGLPPGINTQAAYDQTIHVKPNDPNFVLIGGTDLYRSTNGFLTTAATTVIGGYPYYLDGHHPDHQGGAFSPVNPNVYYSANDGGVQKANDITLATMVWTSLNNGYNVTQLYSVAIPPDAGSNVILAGAQDNGSQLGNAPGASSWGLVFGGDGTVVEVSPMSHDRLYTQYQNGFMQRMQWNGSDIRDITPKFSWNRLFVNPIVLDPNDPAILYYGGGGPVNSGSGVWRNSNAPLADTLTGWVELPGTDMGNGAGYPRQVSAIGVSTANSPNVLYYGSIDGVVKRVDNANGAPVVTPVTPPAPGTGTASGGFVRCIAVDPENSNRALVVYGNYNYPSLWYTTNGGASWTEVEGNLAGPTGPSIRWATMFYYQGQLQVFLGTSIGVLSTNSLLGAATVWSQEAQTEIGNVLIAWMDYRPSDHTLAVATHGRGVFTTQFQPVTAVEPVASRVMLGQSYPNPAKGPTTIAFDMPREAPVSLRVYDVAGREVAVLAEGSRGAGRHQVSLAAQKLAPGSYHYVLKALGAVETRRLTVAR